MSSLAPHGEKDALVPCSFDWSLLTLGCAANVSEPTVRHGGNHDRSRCGLFERGCIAHIDQFHQYLPAQQ